MIEYNKDKTTNTSNMGLSIALGAGLGVVFGEFVFDNVGVGIAIGAALGIALSGFSRSK